MSQSQAAIPQQQTYTRRWPPRLYLAVDCGGTKAAATICDGNNKILGKGRGGPSNYTDEALPLFLASVEAAVKDAIEDIGRNLSKTSNRDIWTIKPVSSESEDTGRDAIARADQSHATSSQSLKAALQTLTPKSVPKDATVASVTAAWFGIAGVDSPADVTTLSPHLSKLLDLPYPSSRLIVANDTSLLASPIADTTRADIESGIVAIAGTGSIVMSFRKSRCGLLKVLGRVGGLGWILGDEGSGYLVGRTAIRTVLDLADRERLEREGDIDDDDYSPSADCTDEEDEEQMEPASRASRQSKSRSSFDDSLYPFSPDSIAVEDVRQELVDSEVVPDEITSNSNHAYGSLLRDRILQEWGLSSTDELLRAVYYEEPPTRSISPPETDTIKAVISNGSRLRGFSKMSLSSDWSRSGESSPSVENAHCSLNLLPPAGSTIDEETRLRGRSPIPFLSSSLSDTGSALLNHYSRGRTSTSLTEVSSATSTTSTLDTTSRPTCDRKHRLASLTPLIFHLAFSHDDKASRDILQSQAYKLAIQIKDLLRPCTNTKAYLQSKRSVLCLGGALVGQSSYRNLLVEELAKLGIVFAAVEYVADPATRGAEALSNVAEQRIKRLKRKS